MSKLNCSNCKYYDFNACDGIDWCKLNHEETGICGNCDREFEDLEEATTHYDAIVEENNTFLIENSKMAGELKDLQTQLTEKDKYIDELKQTINTLQQNTISASVDDVNLIHELEHQLAECKEKLEESFCQEDVEGLIKDRDITIKSLKEQLTGYQQELETYKKKPINVYQMEIRNLQVDKAELKLEIEEKYKEIERLKAKVLKSCKH